jgi:hypothetical protein
MQCNITVSASRSSTCPHLSFVSTLKSTSTSLSLRRTVVDVPAVSSASVLQLPRRRRRVATKRRRSKLYHAFARRCCMVMHSVSHIMLWHCILLHSFVRLVRMLLQVQDTMLIASGPIDQRRRLAPPCLGTIGLGTPCPGTAPPVPTSGGTWNKLHCCR